MYSITFLVTHLSNRMRPNLSRHCIDHLTKARVRVRVRVNARARTVFRVEEIVKFRRVVGSDWLEYIYNV